jgi:ATP-dependent Clp protease adaptor protein ClpS
LEVKYGAGGRYSPLNTLEISQDAAKIAAGGRFRAFFGMATRHREDTVLEAKKSKTRPPPMFKVLLLNDDYTPMDFVVLVLQKFFALSRERATQVMLKVHREGMGVCGIYPKDLAATKVEQVRSYAKQHQHPLQCVMEEN